MSNPLLLDLSAQGVGALFSDPATVKEHPGGFLALVPEARQGDIGHLQRACTAHGLPLYGAVFPATIVDAGFDTGRAWLLPLPTAARATLFADLTGDPAAAAARLAEAVAFDPPATPAGTQPTLLLVFDAQLPRIESVLEALYARLGERFRYVGVNAGSETFQPMDCLFDAQRTASGGALALVLCCDRPIAIEHGYQPSRTNLLATASEGNRIITIDWRPAFDVYRELTRRHFSVELTPENFYQHAVHFPFGILRATGEVLVRIPVQLGGDGSMACVGEVPPNSILVVLEAPSRAAANAVPQVRQKLGPSAAGALLATFYCAGRRMHFGDAAADELAELQRITGAGRLAGALSLGELGSDDSSYPLFHNAAIVCLPWGPA
jgi:hypothetical protein